MLVSGQATSVAAVALLTLLPVRATLAPLDTTAMWDLGVDAFGKGTFAISPFCTAERSPQVRRRNHVLEGVVGFSFVTLHWDIRVGLHLAARVKCTTIAIP